MKKFDELYVQPHGSASKSNLVYNLRGISVPALANPVRDAGRACRGSGVEAGRQEDR